MKEELISFECAKLAKEKGFNESTVFHYDFGGSEFMDDLKNSEHEMCECSAPTQSLLQKWLREEKDIYVCVENGYDTMSNYNRGFNLTIQGIDYWHNGDVFETYEQALEQGLIEALKLI